MSQVAINIIANNLTGAGFAGATRNLNGFRGAVLKHQMALRMAGQDMRMVGRTMTRYISLPVVAAGAASIKFAYDYENAMMRVASLTESSKRDMKLYQSQIMDMAQAVGKSPKELAEGLYFISSAGFTGKQALSMLNQAARSSAAGMGEVKDNADAMTSAIHAYGKGVLSAKKANDVLVQSVISGKMEPDELARSLGRVIAPAEQAGVKFWEVGAAVASLSRVGLSARMSTFSLRSLFMSLVKPTKEASDKLKSYGLSYKETFGAIKSEGLFNVLMKIKRAVKEHGGGMRDLASIFNANSLNAFLAMTGKSAGKVKQVFDQLEHSAGRAGKAFKTATQSDAFKLRQAWFTLVSALTKLGIVLLPIVTKVVGLLNQAVKWFSTLSPATQTWILKLVLLAAVLGPVISGLGGFIQILPTLARMITGIGTGFAGLGRLIFGVGEAATLATPAVGGLLGGSAPMTGGLIGLLANPWFIGAAAAITGIAIAVKRYEDSLKSQRRAQLQPVLYTKGFTPQLLKQLAKKGWKERVVDGVVYFDYTLKPRAKGRGGSFDYKGLDATARAELQRHNVAAQIQKTVENAWVRAQAAVLAYKGKTGFDMSLMMQRKQAQDYIRGQQNIIAETQRNLNNLNAPLAHGAPVAAQQHRDALKLQLQQRLAAAKEALRQGIQDLSHIETGINRVNITWPKFDYSKGLAYNLRQIRKWKKKLQDEITADVEGRGTQTKAMKLHGIKISHDKQTVTKAGGDIIRTVGQGASKSKSASNAVKTVVQKAVNNGKTLAAAQAPSIGAALSTGAANGVILGALAPKVAEMVRQGIAAGMAAAEASSPSKKMMKLGNYLTEGLTKGVVEKKAEFLQAVSDMVSSVQSILESYVAIRGNLETIRVMGPNPTKVGKKLAAKVGKYVTAIAKVVRSHVAKIKIGKEGKLADQLGSRESIIGSVSSILENFLSIHESMDRIKTEGMPATSFGKKMAQKVGKYLTAVVKAFLNNIKKIKIDVSEVVTKRTEIIESVTSAISGILDIAKTLSESNLSYVLNNTPKEFFNAVAKFAVNLVKAVRDALKDLSVKIAQALNTKSEMVQNATGAISGILDLLKTMMEIDANKMLAEMPETAFGKLAQIVTRMVTVLSDALSTIVIPDSVANAAQKIQTIAESMMSVLNVMKEVAAVSMGEYGDQGWNRLVEAVRAMLTAAANLGIPGAMPATTAAAVGPSISTVTYGRVAGDVYNVNVNIATVNATNPQQAAAAGKGITQQVIVGMARAKRRTNRGGTR